MSKGLVKAVVGAVLALALAMTALLFNGYRSGRSVEFTAGAESADAPVQVLLLIREVDPVKGELRMRVFVTPGEGEDAFTTAYVVETSSEVAKEPLAVGAGKASASTDVVVSFDDGEELMYPFDRYRASVDVVVREAAGSEADGSADAGAPVPVNRRVCERRVPIRCHRRVRGRRLVRGILGRCPVPARPCRWRWPSL